MQQLLEKAAADRAEAAKHLDEKNESQDTDEEKEVPKIPESEVSENAMKPEPKSPETLSPSSPSKLLGSFSAVASPSALINFAGPSPQKDLEAAFMQQLLNPLTPVQKLKELVME